jgi:hypothetical protein
VSDRAAPLSRFVLEGMPLRRGVRSAPKSEALYLPTLLLSDEFVNLEARPRFRFPGGLFSRFFSDIAPLRMECGEIRVYAFRQHCASFRQGTNNGKVRRYDALQRERKGPQE